MRIGNFEVYSYKVHNPEKRFKNYTNDAFFGKNRVFRYNIFVFGLVIDINLWKNKVTLD